MRLNRRQWMGGVSALFACSALPRSAQAQAKSVPPPANLTASQIREDLTFLRTQWAPLDRSFSGPQRLAFDQAVDDSIARAEAMSPADLALDVMRAVAIARNGHTAVIGGSPLGDLPIRTWWFSDGLYVLSSEPTFTNLLGARVEKFGTLTPEETLARVAPYISGTDQRIHYLSASYLTCLAILRRIGATPGMAGIPLTLRLRDGTSTVVKLDATGMPDPSNTHMPVINGWSVLIPDDKDMPDRWPHVLDSVGKHSPGLAKPASFFTRWIGDDGKVLYIRSNRIESKGEDRLDEKLLFGALQDLVVPRQPRSVVVDLRLNNGGNFLDTALFAQSLPKLVPPDGRIFVLISRATFSAALATAAMLKGAGQGKVTFIGEPMGDNGHFWAEVGTRILPNSQITVSYATKFEDYEHGCADLNTCYWPVIAFGPRNISIAPDVRVDVSFADYASGRDPVLENALALAK